MSDNPRDLATIFGVGVPTLFVAAPTLYIDKATGILYFNKGATAAWGVGPNGVSVSGTKKYVALLTQSGTDAPVATVLENTLGGTVVWTYSDVGQYSGTLAGAFSLSKTHCQLTPSITNISGKCAMSRIDNNTIAIYVLDVSNTEADSILSGASISITIYP